MERGSTICTAVAPDAVFTVAARRDSMAPLRRSLAVIFPQEDLAATREDEGRGSDMYQAGLDRLLSHDVFLRHRSTRAREKIMSITLSGVNPSTYSNLGDPLSISGTGFQDRLIRITEVTVKAIPGTPVDAVFQVLSDSVMLISGPTAIALGAGFSDASHTSDVYIAVIYESLDDFGNVVLAGQSAPGPLGFGLTASCMWLPGVQSIEILPARAIPLGGVQIPNVLWRGGSPATGTVNLNEHAASPGDDMSVVQVPLLAVTNTDRQDVTVEPSTVRITGQDESSGNFTVVAKPSAVPGDTFTIVSTPDPSLDPYGYYATATGVIGTPPIYLDLPRSFTDGTQISGVVYVENPIAGTSVSLAVDPPSSNPGIPPNPHGSGGAYAFLFTPSVPTTVTFNVTVTYGALQQTFGPYICLKSPPVPPPRPPGPGPI